MWKSHSAEELKKQRKAMFVITVFPMSAYSYVNAWELMHRMLAAIQNNSNYGHNVE